MHDGLPALSTQMGAMMEKISSEQHDEIIMILQNRFMHNMKRHEKADWVKLLEKLEAQPLKLAILYQMEKTGGEPDVVSYDEAENIFTFFDCSAESPAGRRSLCYDQAALAARKQNKPAHSAIGMAGELGFQILDESQYRSLQQLDNFDLKTSSWIKTTDEIRKAGGALFCDRRYGQVFTYHNGADSYYSARGFRGCLMV